MKKTIVVADRDESLQHAFMTVFSKAHFEIIYASTGKEVERIAEKMNPDVYIVNVDLPKTNGIEVYKKLQKTKLLDKASFFFLKDESDSTVLGYQADGVIEKPINFFRVYETVTREDEAIELTDLVDERPETPPWQQGLEKAAEEETGFTDLMIEEPVPLDRRPDEDHMGEPAKLMDESAMEEETIALALSDEEVRSSIRQIGERLAAELDGADRWEKPSGDAEVRTTEEWFPATDKEKVPQEEPASSPIPVGASEEGQSVEEELIAEVQEEVRLKEEQTIPSALGDRLRDVMDGLSAGRSIALGDSGSGIEEMGGGQSELEAQFKAVLNQAMEEAALKLSGRLAPVLTRYVEDYVKRMLLKIAEKVVRQEIEKLLKESIE